MIIDEIIKELQERGARVGVKARDFYDEKYYDGPIIRGKDIDITNRKIPRRGPDKKPRKRAVYRLASDFQDCAEVYCKDMMIKKEMMKNKGL